MGRKNKNITIQLNRRIDELLRIGEKKAKVNGRVDGIHSVQTAESYRGTANLIGEVCKSMGVRNIEDIDKGVIERYMEDYRNASALTVSREIAAANKLLGTSYTPRDFGFTQRRTYTSVKNNRGEFPRTSDANKPENQDGLYFARYSDENQRINSIEGQIRECTEFANKQGYTLVGHYCNIC